jgi:hemolysin activation/secretion protein
VVGKGKIVGARYVTPMESIKGLSQSTSLGLDYKDVQDIVNVQDKSAIRTPIQYIVAGATYSATSYDDSSTTSYTAGINLGVRGPNSSSEFEDKRFKANPDFIYFRGDIARSDRFGSDYKIESSVKLQLTDSTLISNEQFTAGGTLTVRGYLESQVLGDNGIAGGIELYSPKLFYSEDSVFHLRMLGFIEGASVKTLEPLPGQEHHAQLISTGLGLRVTKSKQFSLKIDWAYPLYDAGDAGSGTLINKGDTRLVASLEYTF